MLDGPAKHVELDLVALRRHGHGQNEVIPAPRTARAARHPRRCIGVLDHARLAKHHAYDEDESAT
jgi:hypothetical protein